MKFRSGALSAIASAACLAATTTTTQAIYAEDAGKIDFLIATPGHSVTRFVHPSPTGDGDSFITSDSAGQSGPTSCYVAKRSTQDGSVLWRRNVCTQAGQSHAVAVADERVFTVDSSGILKAWSTSDAQLDWEAKIGDTGNPKAWTFTDANKKSYVAAAAGQTLIVISSSGQTVGTVSASSVSSDAQWLEVLPVTTASNGLVQALAGTVGEDGLLKKKPTLVELDISAQSLVTSSSSGLGHFKGNLSADSIHAMQVGDSWQIAARASEGSEAFAFGVDASNVSENIPMSVWGKLTSDVYSINADKAGSFSAATYCDAADVMVGVNFGSVEAWKGTNAMEALSVTGETNIIGADDELTSATLLSCSANQLTMLLSTESGTATALRLDVDGSSAKSGIAWTKEDGLSTISTAIMLDGSHIGSDDLVGEEAALLNRLSFSSRLSSQFTDLTTAVSARLTQSNKKDHAFGFVKIAVLLSQSSHRVWGLDTAGPNRGNIKWTIDLPKSAKWHTMVHGTKSSKSAAHGINGGTHSREILVLSAQEEQIDWKCIDGTDGDIHAEGSVAIASPVIQIVPFYGSGEFCRQGALALHSDMSISAIPNDNKLKEDIAGDMTELENGFFSHVVRREDSKLESVQIKPSSDGAFVGFPVGQTAFAGEKIVGLSYPVRDEIVQRMSTTLGDNSLLLKYINPHLVAIVTVASNELTVEGDISSSMSKKNGTGKRKPVGVTNETPSASEPPNTPNLFVNLVDTVTGRIIHRTSHINADTAAPVSVIISENWVIYTFVNQKSRRTELGVLTMHEGMIDSKSLTAFSTPEQASSFSSFNTKESKPVVLSKLYTFPKAVTALGATATRDGISARNIMFATADGKITSIPRQMLETRRPSGELKPAEKTEGLVQYMELIPMVPLMTLTYNKTVEGVQNIISVHTGLESQSLVLAFGGPDIFFTRTSPTKGFDLLPESFSHTLVSIVTVGILVVLAVVKTMSAKKTIKQGWV